MSERGMSAEEYVATVAGKAKKSKYSNVKTEVDGVLFDSKAEARRYRELKILLDSGKIVMLTLQPKYHIHVNGVKICDYIADFSYYFAPFSTKLIVEDVKGMKTPMYRMKKKLMKAVFGIDIQEV